ncbi:ATP-dependent nuclease [Paraglaciecola aestuariivivens]
MYEFDQKPATHFSDDAEKSLKAIRESEYAVLVGRNNCGKSFLLKTLTQRWGKNASYLGPARYHNFHVLGHYTPNRNKKDDKWRNFINQWNQQQQNIDNSPINLQQAIAELTDKKRETLSEIIELLLGSKLEIRYTVPDNDMSQKFISVEGHNISYTSSGFRLITTLVTSLLDDDYDTYLIDEPELGISPEAQGVLADFLFDKEHRKNYFPHIKTLVLATHSTVFLDRKRISNNYTIEKAGDEISVGKVATQQEFNKIHFFLLGNRFETLYLPSLIVLVEGKSDHAFIREILTKKYPNVQFSVVSANSDSRIKEVLNTAKNLLTDIQKSPYRDRIVVVLDSVHGSGLRGTLEAMGVLPQNIVIWSKNGIEYFYPESIMAKIFGEGGELLISGDDIARNGISYKKAELADKVCKLITADTPMDGEFSEKFMAIVDGHVS